MDNHILQFRFTFFVWVYIVLGVESSFLYVVLHVFENVLMQLLWQLFLVFVYKKVKALPRMISD